MPGKRGYWVAGITGLLVLIIVLAGLIVFGSKKEDVAPAPPQPEPEVIREYGLAVDSFRIEVGSVPRNQVFGELFKQLGANPAQLGRLTEASQGIFDLRKVKAGNMYKAFYPLSHPDSLHAVVYEHSPTEYFR